MADSLVEKDFLVDDEAAGSRQASGRHDSHIQQINFWWHIQEEIKVWVHAA
jgi:hypothetical protein